MKTLLVTGGAGFIGSAFVRKCLALGDYRIVNLDALTYAGNPASLATVERHPNYRFVRGDIRDGDLVAQLLAECRPSAIVHLAAESHVDRSIDGPAAFVDTNIVGTFRLLEAALRHWRQMQEAGDGDFRFYQVSTDEVFGSLGPEGAFSETSPYSPNSPYSASKAAADHLVRAWHHTFGLPVVTSNCSNNFGPYQFPEKLIPLTILNAVHNLPLPVYGDGAQVRDWLYVDDHVECMLAVLERGRLGECYNIGGDGERRNIDIVRAICEQLDEIRPLPAGQRHEGLIRFVTDRPGHDRRYAIDSRKARSELGWTPRHEVEAGLAHTVRWYLENRPWWHPLAKDRYANC